MTPDEYDRPRAYDDLHSKYMLFEHRGSCFYCGDADTTDDHVPPLKILYRLRGHDSHLRPLLVRSCMRCNSSLGDIALMTPIERRDYIQRTALPRQIAGLRAELAALRNRYDEAITLLDHLVRLSGAETRTTFAQIPVGHMFRLVGAAGEWQKTSDRTYKGTNGTRVGEPDTDVEWSPSEPALPDLPATSCD